MHRHRIGKSLPADSDALQVFNGSRMGGFQFEHILELFFSSVQVALPKIPHARANALATRSFFCLWSAAAVSGFFSSGFFSSGFGVPEERL